MNLRKIPLRRHFFMLLFFISCTLLLTFYVRYQWLDEKIAFRVLADDSIKNFLVDTAGCRVPAWDPWDDSVKSLFTPIPGRYQCPGQPSLLRVLPNAVIDLDETFLHLYYEVPSSNVSCTYQDVHRDMPTMEEDVDSRVTLGLPKNLTFRDPLSNDFIKTSCKLTKLEEEFEPFVEFLPLTPLKITVEERSVARLNKLNIQSHLNVIFLGIDSISSLNFIRHFPKCNEYLSNVLSSISLKGYTKVGDNTFPNLVPFLTGHFYQHFYDFKHNESMFFDDVDFSWKSFVKHGYRTFYAEDAPDIATFNYYRNGFKYPPADYYYRPFALAVENSDVKAQSKKHCFGNKMEMEVIFNYLKSFVDTMGAHRPFFAFVFLARLTHDVFNYAGYADEPTFQLLRYLHDTQVLNNTMLVFFSDHGIRYGPIRKTYIGQFEERMPFIHLVFPQWFKEKHREEFKHLQTNSERLTSPFDVHATTLHLASLITGDRQIEPKTGIGISLFREIPADRTCSQAGITPHWCPCQIQKPVPRDDPVVIEAAQAVISTVNNWTSARRDLCAILELSEVLDARIAEKRTADPHQTRSYLIVLAASPSEAIFEATIDCNVTTSVQCQVIDDISRINEYGKQSICAPDAILRKFCYCI